MVRRFKIVFWENGNKCVEHINAASKYEAKMKFYRAHPYADIIKIEVDE